MQRRRPFEEEVPRFFVSARVRRAPAQEGLLVRCVHGRARFTQMSPVTNDRDFVFDWDAGSEGSFGARHAYTQESLLIADCAEAL